MGRILEHVVLLSSLTLVLGVPQHKEVSQGRSHERENLTHVVKQYFPKERNAVFGKRVLPLDMPPPLRRVLSPPKPKQMRSTLGLRAFATDDPEWKTRRRNHSESNGRHFLSKAALPPFSQALYPRTNSKMPIYHGETPTQRISTLEDFGRRYHKEARTARHHQRYSPKVCDPCNSVPWVPLLKVPDSYRQQRTHVTEIHPTPQQSFNLDYHGFATDAHNVFLPPVPIVPPFDGTISSSFGLPIGNIPTGHGLLAPINPLATVATHGIDYASSFNFFSPPGLLEGNSIPELSPVPIVPIHDSGQFYQFDSSIPDLVPPPSQNLDVSKVVLTISEDNTHDLQPPKPPPKPSSSTKEQTIDFGKLEIVKSIPLAEFTSSNTPSTDLPLYPPLQTDYSTGYGSNTDAADHHPKSTASHPPKTSPSPPKTEPQGAHSAPEPLTSSSLSWLFSDHTAPPTDSKAAAAASVASFVTESREIASAVNHELRPVSPHPLTSPPPNKTKKIQIIIPYTTKNKSDRDSSALESVRHEVFQPPGTGSALESESSSDLAHSATTALAPGGEEEAVEKEIKEEEHKNRKFLSEMHHIIASNIRELLKEEIEKSKKEQNYPLQNNIDNWTALEYSNHKALETKAPKEIITQALAVTSIPGTSISHLLLPSKKIPEEYFSTTPSPTYDEPTTFAYRAANSTVNSSPFTARPYATTSIYTPARAPGESERPPPSNHGTTYSEVARGKVNSWGKLNENLVLPEARSKTRRKELPTTRSGSPFRLQGTERLEIVTPVPLTTQRNYTTAAFRRTTREVGRSEETTTASEEKAEIETTLGRTTEETTTALGRRAENATEVRRTTEEVARTEETTTAPGRRAENATEVRRRTEGTTTGTPRPSFLGRLNSTRLERVSNPSSAFGRKLVYSTTTDQIRNSSRTSGSATARPISAGGNETIAVTGPTGSINDVFPFRNKELPWQTNLDGSDSGYRTTGERKTLIKQRSRPSAKSS